MKSPTPYAEKYRLSIIGCMRNQGAINTTDEEIERTLKDCAGSGGLIPAAKELRDLGLLDIGDIKDAGLRG